MTGKAILRTGAKTQGQGHETTWAQIVAHELGMPAEDIVVEEGDTDTAPFGMGTYASRSTPVAGAAVAMVSRKVRAKARKLAAHLLEVSEEDIEWELGRFYVRSSPDAGRHHPGVRDGRVQQHARRHGARPGERRLLRPAQPHLAVRLLHRHRRGRPADRRLGRAADGRGRRLRRADQPDDRRGPDHGRAHRGVRHGQHAVHHLRRRRATASGRTTWTTCCPPRGRPRATSCTRSSRRARTTRSGPRASASARRSAARPRSSTR